jgi:hypothetical protein
VDYILRDQIRNIDESTRAVFANEEEEDGSNTGAFIFSSYRINQTDIQGRRLPRNYDRRDNHDIVKVCRATTAAPTFLRPQVIDGRNYTDAGLGINNPTEETIDEIRGLHGHTLRTVASFGTGKRKRSSQRQQRAEKRFHRITRGFNVLHEIFRSAKAGLTDCEKVHLRVEKMAEQFSGQIGGFEYFRFNVEEGLGKMKIDENKPTTLATIMQCTRDELSKPEVQQNIRALAEDLVEHRRYRMSTFPSQWERFTCCTTYVCTDGCVNEKGHAVKLDTRDEMSDHLQKEHLNPHESEQELKARLDHRRQQPQFPVGPW